MKCQRCGNGKITHRVLSDIINLLVCTDCAHQADACKGLIVTTTEEDSAGSEARTTQLHSAIISEEP